MKSLKLAEKRHSVREYKHKKLSESDRQYLDHLLIEKPSLAHSSSLEFHFVEDGYDMVPLLEGVAGYFGIMIEAPHYYAVLCEKESVCCKLVGYVGEWLILNALKENIGSCWLEVINSNEVKSILNIESPKEVAALIAIGYAKKERQMSSIYASTGSGSLSSLTDLGYPNIEPYNQKGPASYRKPITDLVYLNEWGNTPDIEELERMGIHEALFYMRLAPSYGNRQPWLFMIKNNKIDLIIEETDLIAKTVQCIDAGIAMFYFEVGLHDIGIKGGWSLSDFVADYEIPEGHRIVGRYEF